MTLHNFQSHPFPYKAVMNEVEKKSNENEISFQSRRRLALRKKTNTMKNCKIFYNFRSAE